MNDVTLTFPLWIREKLNLYKWNLKEMRYLLIYSVSQMCPIK